jgi:hypothetical protein
MSILTNNLQIVPQYRQLNAGIPTFLQLQTLHKEVITVYASLNNIRCTYSRCKKNITHSYVRVCSFMNETNLETHCRHLLTSLSPSCNVTAAILILLRHYHGALGCRQQSVETDIPPTDWAAGSSATYWVEAMNTSSSIGSNASLRVSEYGAVLLEGLHCVKTDEPINQHPYYWTGRVCSHHVTMKYRRTTCVLEDYGRCKRTGSDWGRKSEYILCS